MLRSWLGTIAFRRYVAAISRRVAARRNAEARTEGRWRRLRAWLIRHGDPVVMMAVGQRILAMPLSHELPVYRALFASYDRTLAHLAKAHHDAGVRLVMIDVGANIGDTMAVVLDVVPGARFTCIEGNPRYVALLERNVTRLDADASVVATYCDDGRGAAWQMTGDAHGSARLAPLSQGGNVVATTTLDRLFAGDARVRDVTLLKIDTDGADLRVLRGAATLLRERQPMVYFEFHPSLLRECGDDPDDLFPLLSAAGYSRARLYTNRGDTIGTVAVTPSFTADAEARIDGRVVEYLDILAWAPAHEAIVAALTALESRHGHSPRP